MHNSQEQFALDQTICWNCEELVHISASSCPYCNSTLKRQQKTSSSTLSNEKITPLVAPTSTQLPKEDSFSFEEPKESLSSPFLSSFFLFGGCNLLFLGILVGLFSKDGYFTLSWKEAYWPAYFGCGIALTTLGLLALQSIGTKKH